MAIIPCPECQREISENALFCPHCGFTHLKPSSKDHKHSSTEYTYAELHTSQGLGDHNPQFRLTGDISYLQPSESLPTGEALLKLYAGGVGFICNGLEILIDTTFITRMFIEDKKTLSPQRPNWLNRAITQNQIVGPANEDLSNMVVLVLEFKNIRTQSNDTLIFRVQSTYRSALLSYKKMLEKAKTDNSLLKYMSRHEKFDYLLGCGTFIALVALIVWIIQNCSGN